MSRYCETAAARAVAWTCVVWQGAAARAADSFMERRLEEGSHLGLKTL